MTPTWVHIASWSLAGVAQFVAWFFVMFAYGMSDAPVDQWEAWATSLGFAIGTFVVVKLVSFGVFYLLWKMFT